MERPSRSKIFRNSILNKVEENEPKSLMVFAKLHFILDKIEYSEQEVQEICAHNKYGYLETDEVFLIYEPY